MTEQDWRDRTDNRLAKIESQMSEMRMRDAVAEVHHTNVENRLKAIESSLTWLVRLVFGALIMALLAFAVSGGLK